MSRRFALVVVALALLAACGSGGGFKIKDPGEVPNLTTTTALDFGGIGLKGVSSRTTTSIPMGPGNATLSGTVTGPDGPVDGATVHIERFVGSSAGSTDVTSQPDGTWSLPMILGGRYRVRAWKAPDLALVQPNILYIESSETKMLDLHVDRYTGASASASIAPNPPAFGQPANLFVLVTQKTVDNTGIVRGTAVPAAQVQLSGSGYTVESPNPQTTDDNGIVEWRVRCDFAAQQSLSVIVNNGASSPLQVPPCVDASAPPDTSASTTSTTSRRTPTTRRTTSTSSGL